MSLRLAICVLILAEGMFAATYNSPTCSESDVQNTYNTEHATPVDGDIIAIPSGTCTWTSALVISPTNTLTFQGAGAISATNGGANQTGTDVTTIVDGSTDSSHDYEIFNVTTTTAKEFRITAIAFSCPTNNLCNTGVGPTQNGAIAILGTSQSLRIDHCHFTGYQGDWVLVRGWIYGVLDHNVLDNFTPANNWVVVNNAQSWNGDSGGIGDASWADTTQFGSSKFLFMEDNQIVAHSVSGSYVSTYLNDCSRGGRQVVRHNTMVEIGVTQGHGPKGDDQGCRETEVYLNNQSSSGEEVGAFAGVLSGPALIWGNTLDLIKQIYPLYDGRKGDGTSQGNETPGWSMCQNNDSATLFQGTVNTSGTSVTWVSGGTFSTSWPYESIANVNINGTSYAISSVGSTTSMTLSTSAGTHTGVTYFVPSKWDGNTATSGYPCIDQPGRGQDDLLSGTFGGGNRIDTITSTVTWPNQAIDPVYAWNNTNTWPGDSQDAVIGVAAPSTNIVDNRDYYQQMAVYCFGPANNACGEWYSGCTLSSPGNSCSFRGSEGIGQGTLSGASAIQSAFPTCTAGLGGNTPGVGYWSTTDNKLYVCNPTNTWVAYYTPYTYPHPLQGTNGIPYITNGTIVKGGTVLQ